MGPGILRSGKAGPFRGHWRHRKLKARAIALRRGSEIRMPDVTGLDLLEFARATKSRAPFILMTAVPTMSTAIDAVNLGAYRYVIKTESFVEELSSIVEGGLKEQALR